MPRRRPSFITVGRRPVSNAGCRDVGDVGREEKKTKEEIKDES